MVLSRRVPIDCLKPIGFEGYMRNTAGYYFIFVFQYIFIGLRMLRAAAGAYYRPS